MEKKPIEGFENYLITSSGKIIRANGEYRKTSVARGYEVTTLWKNNKSYPRSISRLVAQHFIDNPLNKAEVNHIDGNKLNNDVSNLEWCTRSENLLHSIRIGIRPKPLGNRKLTQKQVDKIRTLIGTKTHEALAKDFGVKYSTIAHIKRNSRWKQ